MTGASPPTTVGTAGGQVRTLTIRIADDLRAQLDVLAQLTGRTATEEIRLALEDWIVKSKSDPKVLEKAEAVKAEIERDAQSRRNAIAAIFDGGDGTTAGAKAPTARAAGTSKRSQ